MTKPEYVYERVWDTLETKELPPRNAPDEKYRAQAVPLKWRVCKLCGVTVQEYGYEVPLWNYPGPLVNTATEFQAETSNFEAHELFHFQIEQLEEKMLELVQELWR